MGQPVPWHDTLASINAPCSVNTNGNADLGRLVLDVITNCDEIEVHSSTESRNIKSSCIRYQISVFILRGYGDEELDIQFYIDLYIIIIIYKSKLQEALKEG